MSGGRVSSGRGGTLNAAGIAAQVRGHYLASGYGELPITSDTLPSVWIDDDDATISKAFRISESRRLQFRLDATNILNHPEPADPNLDINAGVPFGNIDTKSTATRQFQLGMRLEF